MKFPVSTLDKEEYLLLIEKLLHDDNTIIFFDTNILGLFYRINSLARTEFFDWLKPLILKNRIKIPTWVLNEYTNSFIKNKTSDYLGTLNTIDQIHKTFEEYQRVFTMYHDSTDKDIVIADLKVINEKLASVRKITYKKETIPQIHDEIVENLGQ